VTGLPTPGAGRALSWIRDQPHNLHDRHETVLSMVVHEEVPVIAAHESESSYGRSFEGDPSLVVP